jgi:hypothetical protein
MDTITGTQQLTTADMHTADILYFVKGNFRVATGTNPEAAPIIGRLVMAGYKPVSALEYHSAAIRNVKPPAPTLTLTEADVKRLGNLIYTARALGVFDFEQTIQANMTLHTFEEFLFNECGLMIMPDGDA